MLMISLHKSCFNTLLQLKYFDDPLAKCMLNLDSVDAQDLSQKCEFFTRLAQAIPAFPKVSGIACMVRHMGTSFSEGTYNAV